MADELTDLRQQLSAEVQERKRATRGFAEFTRLGQRFHSARTESEAAEVIRETARALIECDECLIELYDEANVLRPVLAGGGTARVRSNLAVPIRNGARAIGLLTVRSARDGAFGIADANTLQALGDFCGGALDRIRADAARRAAERRMAIFALEAQEQERRRVARELHDGVSQALASIKFRVQSAEDQLARGDERWRETLARSKEMLDSVLDQVRRLSRNLRPGELDDLGLIAAVRTLCVDFQARTGLQLELVFKRMDQRLPGELEVTLYRILQEALTNIERHAGASEVRIVLQKREGRVKLEISDNGCGFDPAAARSGLGLHHVCERAALLAGMCELQTAPGKGLRILIDLPLVQP